MPLSGIPEGAPSLPQLPLGLNLVGGQGHLTLQQRQMVGALELEKLELEIPDLRFPFDASGGAGRFRHRRCALHRALLRCSAEATTHWLQIRAAPRAIGFERLRARFLERAIELDGKVALGESQADFLFRVAIERVGGRELLVSLHDLRLFGAFPVAAPRLAAALVAAALPRPPRGTPQETLPEARIVGCCDVELSPLQLVLLEVLPRFGWRVPALDGVSIGSLSLTPEGISVLFTSRSQTGEDPEEGHEAAEDEPSRQLRQHQEGKRIFEPIEADLMKIDDEEAIRRYRIELDKHPLHPFLLERLLQLSSADPRREAETLALATEADKLGEELQRVALLTRAGLALRRGDNLEAGSAFGHYAELAAGQGRRREELLASLNAGRALISVAGGRALRYLERVLEIDPDQTEALNTLAHLYAELGHWQKLVEVRQRQIGVADEGEQRLNSLLSLGELYRVHLHDIAKAREQYELALEIDSACEPALRGLAEACIDADAPVRAIAPLDRLCTIAQRQGDIDTAQAIHMRIASLWQHLADPESALGRLKKARELRPRDPVPLRRIAALLLDLGRHREATRRLKELLDVAHEPTERLGVHKQLARLYLLHLDDPNRAAEQLERALALDMLDTESLGLRVDLAEKLDDTPTLIEALRQAADAEPPGHRKAELLTRRGLLLIEGGADGAEVTSVLTEAANAAPDRAFEPLRALAMLQERNNDLEAAVSTWRRALDHEDSATIPTGWLHLGRVISRLKRWEEATAALEQAHKLSPSGPEEWNVLSLLADCHAAQGHHAERLKVLRLLPPLLAADGRVAEQAKTLAAIGDLLEQDGEREEARRALESAVSLLPDDPWLLERLGALQHRLGALEEARRHLEAAFKLRSEAEGDSPAPSSALAPVVLHLARVAADQGHNREAIAFYRRALDEGLRSEEVDAVYRRIVDLHLRRGDPAAAARACEAAAEVHESGREQAQRYHDAGQIWLKRATRQDEAVRCFKRALECWSQHRRTLDVLESLANQHGDQQELVEILRMKVEAAAQQPAVQKALLVRLAETLQHLERPDEAHSANANALNLDTNYLPALLFAARRAWDDDDKSEAMRRYQQVLEQLSTSEVTAAQRTVILVESHLRLALCWEDRDADRQSEVHLMLVLEVDPLQAEALATLDDLLHRQERWEELVLVRQSRLQLARGDDVADLQLKQARLLRDLGRVSEAADAYEAVLGDWPRVEILEEVQAFLQEAGDHSRLIQVLRRRAERLERSDDEPTAKADAWVAMAMAAANAGEMEDYLTAVRQAISLVPQHLQALEILLQLSGEGVIDDDRVALLASLVDHTEALPLRRMRLDELVALLEERGEVERASAAMCTAAEHGWASPVQLVRCAELLSQLGHTANARGFFLRILDDEGADSPLKLSAATQLFELGSDALTSDERVALAGRILALDPRYASAWEILIETFRRERRWPQLVDTLKDYLEHAPQAESFTTRCQLAVALARCGRSDEAEETLEEARKSATPAGLLLIADAAHDLGFFEVERLCLDQASEHLSCAALADAKRLFRAADLASQANDFARTRGILRQLVQSAPDEIARAAARRVLAMPQRFELDAEDRLVALEVLQRAGELEEEERWAFAQLLAQRRRSAEALALADTIPAGAVPADELRTFCWSQLTAMGDYESLARRMEREARGASPPLRAEGLLDAARCWAERAGNIEEAARCAGEAAEATPDSGSVIDRIAQLFAGLGAWERGSRLLEELAGPERAAGPRLQANALCHAAELAQGADPASPRCEALHRQALERDRHCRAAHDALVALFEARGDDQELVDELLARAELGEASERSARLLHAANVLIKRLDGADQARALLARSRQLSDAPEVLELIAELELELGDPEAAENTLLALADSGHHPERTLGRACRLAHMRGDSTAEAAHIARLAQLKPEDRSLPKRLLEVYRAAGDLGGLANSLENLAATDPQALLDLAELYGGPLDALSSAYDAYQRYLEDNPQDQRALKGLVTICERLDRPQEQAEALVQLLTLQDSSSRARRGELALRLAALQRDRLDDPEAAIASLRRAQEDLGSGELWASATRQLAQLLQGELVLEVLAQLARSGHATAEELAQLGENAQGAGEHQLAIIAYRQLLLKEPNDKRGDRLLPLLRGEGANEEAAELLEDLAAAALARAQVDRAVDMLVELAEACEALQQPERREAALKRALSAAPEREDVALALIDHTRQHRGDAQLAPLIKQVLAAFKGEQREALLAELVLLHERLDQPQEALRAQEELYHLKQQPEQLIVPILRRAIAARDLTRARQFHDRAAALGHLEDNERVEFNAELAALELATGSTTAARAMLSLALKLDPHHANSLQTLQRLGLEENDAGAIGEASLALAALRPEREVEYLRSAATALRGLEHERARAIEAHKRLLEREPDDAEAAAALEKLLEAEGDLPALAEQLWKQTATAPERQRWQRLAEVEEQLGRLQHAERALREGLRATPESYNLLTELLRLLESQARWGDISDLLHEQLADERWEKRQRADLATRLGLVLVDQLRDVETGAKWLARACTLSPHATAAYRRLLSLHRQKREFEEAARLLRRQIERLTAGKRSEPLNELARLLERKLGDDVAAAEIYEQVYRESPEQSVDALLAAQRIYSAVGAADRALDLLEEGLDSIEDEAAQYPLLQSRAELLAAANRDAEAIEIYQRLVAQKSDPRAHARLGHLLAGQGDNERALPHLQAASDQLQAPHAAAEAAFAAGQVLETLGLEDEAIARYTQSVERDPVMRAGWEALAKLNEARRDVRGARRALGAIEALSAPGLERGAVRRRLGDLHRNRGEWEASVACYVSSLSDDPTSRETLAALEETYAACERWQEVVDTLQRRILLEKDRSEQAKLHRRLAELMLNRLKDLEGAAQQLKTTAALAPDDIPSRQALLAIYERQRRFAESARLALQIAHLLGGDEQRAMLMRAAMAHENAGDMDEAMALYHRLSSADDEVARHATERLAQISSGEFSPIEASDFVRDISGIVDTNDWSVEQHRTMPMPGEVEPNAFVPSPAPEQDPQLLELASSQSWAELADELQTRIRTAEGAPQEARLRLQLASVFERRLDRPTEALDHCQKAADLAPNDPRVIEVAADMLYRHERWPLAREFYDKLYSTGSSLSRAELCYRRGVAHESLGFEGIASDCYAEALALEPDYRDALEARARLALYRDDPMTAITLLKDLLDQLQPDEPERLAMVREQLGEVYLGQDALEEARRYLEAALTADPRREKAMHLLLSVYEGLGHYGEAVNLAQRLVFVVDEPLVRASLLHHRAELLATHLDQEEEAVDCLLRAYDVAPSHTPTLWRLLDYYWNERDLQAVVEMGEDLQEAGAIETAPDDLRRVYLAVAVALVLEDIPRAANLLSPALQASPRLRHDSLTEIVMRAADERTASLLAALLLRTTVGSSLDDEVDALAEQCPAEEIARIKESISRARS